MKQTLWFIINPIAGNSKKVNLEKRIMQWIDKNLYEVSFQYTQYPGHGYHLGLEATRNQIDIVCAVGGDGSVHEIGKALLGSETKMAILPYGSGNGIARHLGISSKIKSAIQVINKGKGQKIDVMQCNDKTAIGFGGFGFDAFIAQQFKGSSFRGFWRYVYLVFKHFFKYKPHHFKIQHDSRIIAGNFLVVSIANASQYGNGFVIASQSDMGDGKLSLVLISPFPWYKAPSILWYAFSKKLHRSRYVEEVVFNEVHIETDARVGQLDGEVIPLNTSVHIKVVPKILHLIIPPDDHES